MRFRARFVIMARQVDDRGRYGEDVARLATRAQIANALEGTLPWLAGGYAFVFDRRIWNSPDHATFDPRRVRCEVDSLSYAADTVEGIAALFDEPIVSLGEMLSMRVRRQIPALELAGLGYAGAVRFPPQVVERRPLLRELLRATTDFLRVAEIELRRRRSRRPTPELTPDDELVERFRRAAARLRSLARSGGPAPRR